MINKEEIKKKMLEEFMYFQSIQPNNIDYWQYHINNIDRIVEERIACLVNLIIKHAIYAYKTNNYNNSGVFGTDYTTILGLSIADLGEFPKNPTIENVDKFIKYINDRFNINMPTLTEYNSTKNSASFDEINEIQRRNGENIYASGQYGDKYLEILANQDVSGRNR